MSTFFNPYWLEPGAAVPVDIATTATLINEIQRLRQALAETDHFRDATKMTEPVAWADEVGAVIPHSHKLFQPDLLKDYTRPLYTAPPKREWVGLTDEDRKSFYKNAYAISDDELIERVEAKLKEKNHG